MENCKALSATLPGRVFFSGSLEYNESRSYFTAFENELSPACVVRPSSADDVATIIKIVSSSALSGKIKLAVRSGGHTPWPGAANVNEGITIDLRNITGVRVDSQTNVVSIGAGERWRNIYEQLDHQGLAVVGGRVANAGIAGLTTGGGLSYFSTAEGFVCDNVVNYEVVVASGYIVQANAEANRDLFLALKGGSNNFGIVTRFDLPTFPQGKMWGGAVFYDGSTYPQIIQALYDLAASSSPDEKAHVLAGTSWSAGRETGVSNINYSTPQAAPPSLVPFTTIQPQVFSSLRQDTLLGFTEEQANFHPDGRRLLFFTTCFRLDLQLMSDVHELWLEALHSIETVPGLSLALIFQPLTREMLANSAKHGGNSLGLTPEDGPLLVVLVNSVHANSSDDDQVVAAALGLIEKIDKLAPERNKAARYRFLNYGYKGQKILEGYGKESLKRMRDVSRKYDPDGFFQKAVPGGFKLSEVFGSDWLNEGGYPNEG